MYFQQILTSKLTWIIYIHICVTDIMRCQWLVISIKSFKWSRRQCRNWYKCSTELTLTWYKKRYARYFYWRRKEICFSMNHRNMIFILDYSFLVIKQFIRILCTWNSPNNNYVYIYIYRQMSLPNFLSTTHFDKHVRRPIDHFFCKERSYTRNSLKVFDIIEFKTFRIYISNN